MSSIYSMYNLSLNPFLDERHDYPRIDREASWDSISKILQDLISAPSCGFIIIFGEYGMGKSFTLKKIEDAINTKDRSFAKSENEILSCMLKTIDSKPPSYFSIDLIIRIIRKLGKEKFSSLASRVDLNSIKDESLKTIVGGLADGNETIWNWFCGRNLSKTELDDLGIIYNMSNPKEASLILNNFLKILKICNVGNLVVLLDEWEFLLSIAGRSKLLEIVHELQKIYDSYNENQQERDLLSKVIFTIGTSADAWNKFLEMVDLELESRGGGGTQTLLRRIPHEAFIELPPLIDKDVKEFILGRLNNFRENKSKSLEPFDNDYVKYISTLSQGVPSRILRISALLLKVAAENKIKVISSAAAEKIVREYGLYAEYVETQS